MTITTRSMSIRHDEPERIIICEEFRGSIEPIGYIRRGPSYRRMISRMIDGGFRPSPIEREGRIYISISI